MHGVYVGNPYNTWGLGVLCTLHGKSIQHLGIPYALHGKPIQYHGYIAYAVLGKHILKRQTLYTTEVGPIHPSLTQTIPCTEVLSNIRSKLDPTGSFARSEIILHKHAVERHRVKSTIESKVGCSENFKTVT